MPTRPAELWSDTSTRPSRAAGIPVLVTDPPIAGCGRVVTRCSCRRRSRRSGIRRRLPIVVLSSPPGGAQRASRHSRARFRGTGWHNAVRSPGWQCCRVHRCGRPGRLPDRPGPTCPEEPTEGYGRTSTPRRGSSVPLAQTLESPAMARPAHDYARVDKHVPVTRRAETANPYSPVMILISVIATLGILFYAQFLLDPDNRGDFLPYALVIAAESVLVAHALLAMWTILSGTKSPRDFAFHAAKRALFDQEAVTAAGTPVQPELLPLRLDDRAVTVDVLITVYGESLAKIRSTVTAAMAINGRHRTWILDDGRSEEVRALAAELGCKYVRRLSGNGAKAGNINHALSLSKADFFCVFDADFIPH